MLEKHSVLVAGDEVTTSFRPHMTSQDITWHHKIDHLPGSLSKNERLKNTVC